MKWVTRDSAKVNRVTCPWLIRKFVGPEAEFIFVPSDQVLAVAERIVYDSLYAYCREQTKHG